MKKNILIIFIISFAFACNLNKNQTHTDKNILVKKTTVFFELYKNDTILRDTLNKSISYIRNDTLMVLIGNPKKTNINLFIKYCNKECFVFVEFDSDIPEYNGKFAKRYKGNYNSFIISDNIFKKNDTISGKINTKYILLSDSISYQKKDSIRFYGVFKSIIEDKW